ncbi:hypothetical protein LNQ52_21840 [Klebsiella pneumoniae subsp. pneumoniae]|nr:hypothetical protein [Klebsiella pneumoniae subsp. pneumoniae]
MRVNHIHTFEQLISRYGQGHGCDVCKPLVASVLASCWNEYPLKPAHLPLQDTNDRYFANIQKDGSYSVVPRMAAGEVTPDGLDRHRADRQTLPALQQSDRRPAHRPVWRAAGTAAGYLARAGRRRV